MAKPIFTIAIPYDGAKDISELQNMLEKKMSDYHVLIYFQKDDDVEFKVFYEKDFDEIKFEELKQMVSDSINAIQTK